MKDDALEAGRRTVSPKRTTPGGQPSSGKRELVAGWGCRAGGCLFGHGAFPYRCEARPGKRSGQGFARSGVQGCSAATF